jgi:hypothetical protein
MPLTRPISRPYRQVLATDGRSECRARRLSAAVRGVLETADANDLRTPASYHNPRGMPPLFVLCVTDRHFG